MEVEADLARRKAERPIAFARLWHAEGVDEMGRARTSQRDSLARCAGSVATSIFGGNGAGKTEVAAQLAVAAMLGRQHPDTQRWLRNNGLPDELVPPYPGRVLFSALTGNDSRRVLRAKLAKYLPAGSTWRNQHGDGEAFAYIPGGETKDHGGTCVFKSNDQGPDKYQADEFDIIINDEEHDAPVVEEELGRMGRRRWSGGYILNTMTPLKGFTWVYTDFVKRPKPGYRATWIHGPDNPHLDQTRRSQLFAGLSAARLKTRQFGEFANLSGAIYDAFDRNVHLVDPVTPPPEWTRWVGIDWGARSPHVLWAAESPGGDLVVYREIAIRRTTAEPGLRVSQLVQLIAEAEAEDAAIRDGACVIYRVADSEDPGALEEINAAGLYTAPAAKGQGSVLRGIELVQAMISLLDGVTMEPQTPRVTITRDCPQLVEELTGMRWLPAKEGQEPKPDPACADHGPDALRYVLQYRASMGMV